MGALKLTYYETKNPLKVVYSKTLEEQKSVQRFLSVDPLTHKFPQWSSYSAFFCNPIRFIDPTGMSGEEASTTTKTTTAVLSLGIQGGLSFKLFGMNVSLFGNLGSIDIVGVREGKFVFFKGARREGEVSAGPLLNMGVQQESSDKQLGDSKTERTTTTTYSAGTMTNTVGKEVTEKQVIDETTQAYPSSTVVSEKKVSTRGFGFKIAVGLGLEIKREEKAERKWNTTTNTNPQN